jgi:hypothetical protein
MAHDVLALDEESSDLGDIARGPLAKPIDLGDMLGEKCLGRWLREGCSMI